MHVVLQREDEYLLVSTAVEDITKDPRELDLEISVDELEAIVLDPRFGLRTSRDARQAGVELRGYVDSHPRPLPWGWPPKALAAFTAERLDNVELARTSEFVEPKGPTGSSSGVSLELTNGWTVHLLVIQQPGAAPRACPVDMACRDVAAKDLTLAWAGDRAAMFVDNLDHAFRMYVEGLATPVRSLDEFSEGNRLHELTLFVDSEELSYSMDGQWQRRGEQLDFWIER